MLKNTKHNETLVGNDRYRGYCIDLLDKIAKMCNFSYIIKEVDDEKHGAYVGGKWNGMVGELIDKVYLFNYIELYKFVYHNTR
jgi:hypothetical protein